LIAQFDRNRTHILYTHSPVAAFKNPCDRSLAWHKAGNGYFYRFARVIYGSVQVQMQIGRRYLLFAKEAGTGGAVGHGEEGDEDLKGDKEVFRPELGVKNSLN